MTGTLMSRIENETLKIDLHPEYGGRECPLPHATTPDRRLQQDFFFPVERWGRIQTADEDRESDDINRYQINVDGKRIEIDQRGRNRRKERTVRNEREATSEAKEESSETEEPGRRNNVGRHLAGKKVLNHQVMEENRSIPFERNQTRGRDDSLQGGFTPENDESVSDDLHISKREALAYSLSPCSNMEKGARLVKGKIEINILHP